MTKIKTLTIQFNTPLKRRELPLFRGAIILLSIFHYNKD